MWIRGFFRDKEGVILGECRSQDLEALLLTSFSEEDHEATLPGNLLPQRLLAGVSLRMMNQSSVESGLAAMLQDERTQLGKRAAARLGLRGTTSSVLNGVVKYQFLGGSAPRVRYHWITSAFAWLFAIKEVVLTMSCSAVNRDPRSRWRLYVYPPRQDDLPVRAQLTGGLPGSGVLTTSTTPLVGSLLDVDLDAIASSGFAVQGGRDMVATLLPLFMRRRRCESLNDPVPSTAIPSALGLSKILCWGDLPIVVQGDSVVFP